MAEKLGQALALSSKSLPSTTLGGIARSITFSLMGFVWPSIVLLVATPIILRGLGEAAYGVQALVVTAIGYLSVLNSLQTAGTKYLAEYLALNDRANIRRLLSTTLIFNVMIGLVGALILFGLARWLVASVFVIPQALQQQSLIAFQLAGLAFGFGALGWWGSAILAGSQRYDLLNGISSIVLTLASVGSIVALELGTGLVGVVAANAVSTALATGLYTWFALRLLPGVGWSWTFDRAMFRRVFSYGAFSTTHTVFSLITTQMDRTLLGAWVGVGAVTLYTIPVSVAARIHQLSAKALEVVFPVSSGLEAQTKTDQLKRLFLRGQNLNVAFTVMLSVPLLVLAPNILSVWISIDFAARATVAFQFLVVAYGLLALSVVPSGIVAGLGHPEVNASFSVLLALSNFVGYILFIPRWTVTGAGVASALGSIVAIPVYLIYVNRRFLKIQWSVILKTTFLRPVMAGALVGAALLVVQPFITNIVWLGLTLVGACGGYLGISMLMGVWQASELQLAQKAWQALRLRLSAVRSH